MNIYVTNVNNMFPPASCVRDTRLNELMQFKPKFNKTKFGDKNLPNRSEQYWKTLPLDVRKIDKLNSFKNSLKSGNFFEHIK